MNNFKYKNILITGGTGFLGKNIVPYLKQKGADVTATGRNYDLTNWDKAEELFKLKEYDLIIHGAAFQGAGDFTLKYPADQFFKNNLIHTNALELWKRHQPSARFVGLGSTCSYPGGLPVLSEDDYFTGPLHPSVEIYGLTKCVMQQGIKAYKKQYGLQGTTVVFATLYGPHDEFDISRSHVVSALVQKFCEATANIGTGVETSIKDLAETIKRLSGFQGEIFYNINRFVGVKKKVLDISRAKEAFGWTIKNRMTPLEEGISKTIKWYKENEQSV